MTDTTAAKQRWLNAVYPFVRGHLPPAPCRVIEIGCGPSGGFVPALRERGYQAFGIDPVAPGEPGYYQTEFEHHELTTPFDAIVACASLHHVGHLGHVLDRAAAAMAPSGVFIIMEWAYEKFDTATAQWCFQRLPAEGEPGWLHHHRQLWLASDQPWHAYLESWARQERLHQGQAIIHALEDRFRTRLLTEAPYFFSDLHPTTETEERAAAHRGEIRATGFRYVGSKP